jgi:hypothetical protein
MPPFEFTGGQTFTPEKLETIEKAFKALCHDLGLLNRDDPLVRIVAKAVIDVAAAGEFDTEQLRHLARKRLTFFDARDSAVRALLSDALNLTGADLGNIQRYEPADASLAIVVQQGFKEEFLRTFERVSLNDTSACARAMKRKEPILIRDVSLDDDFKDYRDVAQRAGFVSVLSLPLLTSSAEFVGVLSVHFAKARALKEIRMDSVRDYVRHAADGLAGIFLQHAGRSPSL